MSRDLRRMVGGELGGQRAGVEAGHGEQELDLLAQVCPARAGDIAMTE
ncbi:MAG: hypothetical protein ACRDRW_01775 [Pseudonocardiaceae bacterium]